MFEATSAHEEGNLKKVFKYTVPIQDELILELPTGTDILYVNAQPGDYINGLFQIWALVNPDNPDMETRKFRLAGTGHAITEPEHLEYIGTFFLREGILVFHLFELIPQE